MMESLRLKEENIINYIRNLFSLNIELKYTGIQDIKKNFGVEKETKSIKNKIQRY